MPYKHLAITFVSLLFIGSSTAHAQTGERQADPSRFLISGTEIPELFKFEKYKCYVYERYVVFEIRLDHQAGDRIRVIQRSQDGRTQCDMDEGEQVLFIDGDGRSYHFDGLYKNHLFVDEGCCPGFRGLYLYDLLTGALVYEASVLTPVSFSYPSLTLRKKTDKTVPCPEAAEWRRKYDFRFAFDEKVVLDLNTLREEYSGEVTCIPQM